MPTVATRRVVTVWCPDWPITAAGLAADLPAIVLRANRVIALSAAARASGVAHGQRRRDAQRRCPEADILTHDPDHDARAFEQVTTAVAAFTPRIEVVEPGWLCLDARGPSRYFGGDTALAVQLADAVRTVAADVRVGIADGRFASAVAARQTAAGLLVIPPDGSPAFLAELPVHWLHVLRELDPDTVGLLDRMGLRRLGDLAALRPADLVDRFGPHGQRAHQIASGLDPRPVHGTNPPEVREAEQRFDTPIPQIEPLLFTAKQLADQITATLSADGQICTRLLVTAETDHQERNERAWYRAQGLTAPAIVDRVRWQLNAWTSSADLTAGIVFLRLRADETRPDTGQQAELWGGPTAADQRAIQAVQRLAGLLGDNAVRVPVWRGGQLPTDRYRWVPAVTVDLTDIGSGDPGTQNDTEGGRPGPWPGAIPPPSPPVVYEDPRPVTLTDTDGQPIKVNARGELNAHPATLTIEGQPSRTVTGYAGPWPLHQRWWDIATRRRAARLQIISNEYAHLVIVEGQQWWLMATYA